MYITKIPSFLHSLYPDYIWRYKSNSKDLYLTFDDGPTPQVTEWVLDQLSQYQALATFFMVGENVKKHPEIAHKVIDAGHQVGNHSQTHKNGWKTETKVYIKDVLLCHQTLSEYTGLESVLFRPPFAKITASQARAVLRTHEVVMMDVISGDFDKNLTGEDCYLNVVKNATSGSIVIFHDSVKAWDRLETALPMVLKMFHEEGYQFKPVIPTREFQYELRSPIA